MNKVFITGATSGLGQAVAEGFLAAGKTVYIHGRSKEKVRSLLKNPHCHYFRQDLLDLGRIGKLIRFVKQEKIDCFVSNAGIYTDLGLESSATLCQDILTTNLVAPILILKEVYRYFRDMRDGTIVSINSLAGLAPNFNEAVYCASKFGMKGYIKSLQLDAYRHNVRILDYYPGAIQTRMTRNRGEFDRFIKPGDIAALIVANVTTEASFVPVTQELRRSPSASP